MIAFYSIVLLFVSLSFSQSAIVNKLHKTSRLHVLEQNSFNDFDTYWTHDIFIDLKIVKINRILWNSSLFSVGMNSKWGSIENYKLIVNDEDVTDDIVVETSVTNSKGYEVFYYNVDFDELKENDLVQISYTKTYNKNMDNISYHHFGSIPFPVENEKLEIIVPSDLYDFFNYEIHNNDYQADISESVDPDDDSKKLMRYRFDINVVHEKTNKKVKRYLNSKIRDSFYVFYYKNNSSWLSAFNLNDYFTKFKQCISDDSYINELHQNILRNAKYDSYIENVYYYIQDNIKYAFVNLHDDGYLPATTKHVLEQNKADCKDYTTIMLKLFRRYGYEAYMIDINTYDAKTLDFRKDIKYLYQFNHAILYVNDGKKEYYLDATGENHHVNDIRDDVEGMNALLINDISNDIKAITIPEVKANENIYKIKFEGSIKNDSLIGSINYSIVGHSAAYYRSRYKNNKRDYRNFIRNNFINSFDKILVDSVTINEYSSYNRAINYSVTIRIPEFIESIAGIKTHKLNFLDYIYNPFQNKKEKVKKTRLNRANFTKEIEYSIKYPMNTRVSYLPTAKNFSNDIHEVDLSAKFENDLLIIKNKVMQKRRILSGEDLELANKNLNDISDYLGEYITF